jgi:hypothetical protein
MKKLSIGISVVAAVLLAVSLTQPLWQMRMEAPQYRDEEALEVRVYPGAMRGDLQEIAVLNRYIGVHVPGELPQFRWLPKVLAMTAGLGLVIALLPLRKRVSALLTPPAVCAALLLVAAIQAQAQMHDIGHRRDARATLVGVKDFTPPFLGRTRIAQFDVRSGLGVGGYLVIAALALQVSAAWLVHRSNSNA